MSDHYTYRITWSAEDGEFVGLCAEFPSLSYLDEDRLAALEGIQQLVTDTVADLQDNNEPVPEPLAEKRFSGSFALRMPPDLHRQLAIEAAEANISLNRLMNRKLAG